MNEQDLYEFAKMFDAAIASDNPAVKKALRNFMLIAAISEAENTSETGPFQGMFDRLSNLETQVAGLRNTQPGYYGNNPTWVSGTGIGYPSPYTVTSSSSSTSGGSSNTTAIDTSSINGISSTSISEQDIIDLMSDLKSDKYWSNTDVSSIEQAYKDSNGK
jgi:hypothetical protein